MNDQEKITQILYESLKTVVDSIRFPLAENVPLMCVCSLVLLLLTLYANIFGFYTFLSWQGCAFCTGFLVCLFLVERLDNSALNSEYHKIVRDVKQVTNNIKKKGGK